MLILRSVRTSIIKRTLYGQFRWIMKDPSYVHYALMQYHVTPSLRVRAGWMKWLHDRGLLKIRHAYVCILTQLEISLGLIPWFFFFFSFYGRLLKVQHYLWTSHYTLRTHARKYRVNICTLIHINGTSWKNICTADEYRRYLNLEQRRLLRELPAKISLRARLIDKWS